MALFPFRTLTYNSNTPVAPSAATITCAICCLSQQDQGKSQGGGGGLGMHLSKAYHKMKWESSSLGPRSHRGVIVVSTGAPWSA